MKYLPLNKGLYALLDDDDFFRIRQRGWHAVKKYQITYVRRTVGKRGQQKCVYLHHEVLGVISGKHIDHINGDGLDNRKENLRITSPSHNQANRKNKNKNNTSGFRGVTFSKRDQIWIAQIMVNRRCLCVGRFDSAIEAAKARDAAALKIFGDCAVLNFPL